MFSAKNKIKDKVFPNNNRWLNKVNVIWKYFKIGVFLIFLTHF
jgi:hypothetical protein